MNNQQRAAMCLFADDPITKVALTHEHAAKIATSEKSTNDFEPPNSTPIPGRPLLPKLVAPRELVQRKLTTPEGRAALIHAVAHIEFNAINLAWDAVYRFPGMPDDFYCDWASVADDEARHFSLLATRLQELGFAYGDFPAHNGLWEMAVTTQSDVLERMALVPRVLEARGLDVTPTMIGKLRSVGDVETVKILETILREEVRHVAVGNHWFNCCCAKRGLDPMATFVQLIREKSKGTVRPPFNMPARIAAGFTKEEMDELATMSLDRS
jgi:uncharacterized ferritin-like protein (DUF455 family)